MSLQNSHQIENVKVMLVKGIDGKGITSVEKTSTSGLVDTYTITYTDGTKDTFTVTNGKGISSIEKTGTSGLVDTYTITFNDGTTGTFTVTNGKSIVSIEKTGTVGLTDTYTITYNDGSTDTFEVVNGGYDVGDQNTAVGNPLSFTTDSAQVAQNTVITFEPIQSGSGDPSPSNVRPISGYDEIDIRATGFNLWDGLWESGSINGNTGEETTASTLWRTKNYILIAPNTDYYVYSSTESAVRSRFYDANKNFITSYDADGNQPQLNAVWTSPPNACYLRFVQENSASKTICVNVSDAEKNGTYEAYNPITDITLELDSTIYGGTLDVESGELVVDRACVDMSTLTFIATGSTGVLVTSTGLRGLIQIPSSDNVKTTAIAEKYKASANTGLETYGLSVNQSGDIMIKVPDNSSFSITGNLAYPLATPLTYHLTPHQVKLLQGANVVTSNGTSISLKWREGQVMTLDDANGLAESIEALGKQGTKVKSFTPETSATMWSDVIDFFLALPPEKQLTAKIFVNYKWYSPAYVSGDDTYFVSGDISAKIVSSTPTIVYMRASKSGLTIYSFACDTGTVTESSQYGIPTLYYLD